MFTCKFCMITAFACFSCSVSPSLLMVRPM